MSIPTHNLYDYIHHATKKQFLMMYFYPWGSRELTDIHYHQRDDVWLNGINGIENHKRTDLTLIPASVANILSVIQTQPILFCHDQEPLNFDLYLDDQPTVKNFHSRIERLTERPFKTCLSNLNLRWTNHDSIQKKWVLLHSELNSSQLALYENTDQYVGAYWWSHAVIARDWYRYAEHDPTLCPSKHQQLFLTYCRDTTGSRTYRQTFLQTIDTLGLSPLCQFSSPDADSTSSAVYNSDDFNRTAISVVLETVFDERIHLTEKILRPIACGHSFILAAGPGSLAALQSYGFKTFHPYINEAYDNELDPTCRLKLIINEMHRIANLSEQEQDNLIVQCREIASYNQTHFFSSEFFNLVINELCVNVTHAFQETGNQLNFEPYWKERQWRRRYHPTALQLPPDKNYKPYLSAAYRQHKAKT